MHKYILFSLLLITAAGSLATEAAKPAQVSFFGVFHFANPGLDVVKSQLIDVTTKENQAYLSRISQNIAEGLAPTKVLVECARDNQDKIDQQFAQFLAGKFDIPVNETYQIGFRVAKLAGSGAPSCYDEREIQWPGAMLMQAIDEKAPDMSKKLGVILEKITQDTNHRHATQSLREILVSHNTAEEDRLNKALYITTNSVGAMGTFEGADSAASWWHRNFRMYANIQKMAQKNDRVLVIGGQGHTAILRDLLSFDNDRQAVDIKNFL